MSSDAEILSPRARPGDAGPEPDTTRWAALVVPLLDAFMSLPDVSARLRHSARPVTV